MLAPPLGDGKARLRLTWHWAGSRGRFRPAFGASGGRVVKFRWRHYPMSCDWLFNDPLNRRPLVARAMLA